MLIINAAKVSKSELIISHLYEPEAQISDCSNFFPVWLWMMPLTADLPIWLSQAHSSSCDHRQPHHLLFKLSIPGGQ